MAVPFVYAEGVDHECCIASNTNRARALCHRRISYRPVVPPVLPPAVHDVCLERWEQRGRYETFEAAEYGTCPGCGGDIPLDEGLVAGHKAWTVGRHGKTRSDQVCVGAGDQPMVDES
ncbi:hypothetical protein [Actinoplanes sp. NPDC051494]|uniref:hypothetical protein n=1 Tax=Actinoplanes sp. NPDC051494 TaxID=3363907 RepID=UPI0037B23A9B